MWCDNHAYSGLMQQIICELSNLSNKLKIPNQIKTRKAKIVPCPYSLPYISRFHLCFSCLISKLLFIWSTGRHFGRLSFPLLILSVSRFLGSGEIDLGPNNHRFKKSACILYGSYTSKMPLGIL